MAVYFDFREPWLAAAVQEITPRIEAAGYVVPENIKISCGMAPGARGSKKIMGTAVSQVASADGRRETFINPILADALAVVKVVFHEVGHHVVGVDAGHGQPFKEFCRKLGLIGKATEALPGPELTAWIEEHVLPVLGDYPHASLDPNARKKQGTRMIKLICPETGYTVRTTKKWLALGVPTSPAGCEMVIAEDEADE